MASFSIEPCPGIVSRPLVRPSVDLRHLLLTIRQIRGAVSFDGPHRTAVNGAPTMASVPSTTPAAYETATLARVTTAGGTSQLALQEVVGNVGPVARAGHLLSILDSALASAGCNPNGTAPVPAPGTVPPLTATVTGGQASSGGTRQARRFAARGADLLCLTWSSTSARGAAGTATAPALVPLPSGPTMAGVARSALSRLPV